MRIGIDARSLLEPNLTGVGEYTLRVVRELLKQGREHEIRLFVSGAKKRELPDLGLARHPKAIVKWLEKPNKYLSVKTIAFNKPHLDQQLGRVDVFFSPNFSFTSLHADCPHVITVHDLSFELFKNFLSSRRKIWHKAIKAKKQALAASHIICDSQSSADDLINLYGVLPERLTVIPLGVANSFTPISSDSEIARVKKHYKLSDRYILSVGTIEPRKNLVSLLSAYELYRKLSGDKVSLVIAGPHGWRTSAFAKALKDCEFKEDINVLGFVKSADRPSLYSGAEVFVGASTYEGFGLPALEAMRCGAPVIASDNSSLPEVVGDAGILVDAEKPVEISQALQSVLSDQVLQAAMIEKGIKRSEQFTWEKTGRATLNVLTSVVANTQWQLQNLTVAPREKLITTKS